MSPRRAEALVALGIAVASALAVIAAIVLARSQIQGDAPVVTVADTLPRVPGNKLVIDAYRVAGSAVRGPIVVRRGAALEIEGWAIDQQASALAQGVAVVVDTDRDYVAAYGRSRPDVAAALGAPALANSGFLAEIPTVDLRPGPHRLTYLVIAHDGTKAYVAGAAIFAVR